MAIPDSESPPVSGHDAAIRGMRRGRELGAQLVALLRRNSGHGWVDEAGELAEEVLECLSRGLSSLDSGEPSEARPLGPDRAGSEGSTGRRRVHPAGERRRGRTRRSEPYAWTKVATKTLDDGHTWRKYGQKEIHGAKYPRCYFRCTHKHDQGCQAARQVQKSEDDPSTFLITYFGNHTCNKPTPCLRPDLGPDAREPFLISFGPPAPLAGGGRGHGLPGQQECSEDDAPSSQLSRNESSPEYLMLPELMPLETMTAGSATSASDVAGDATSGGLGVESFQFEDMLDLEHDGFPFTVCEWTR